MRNPSNNRTLSLVGSCLLLGACSSGHAIVRADDDDTAGSTTTSGWQVEAGGYVTTGNWKGYAWAATDEASWISPPDFASLAADGRLCASGSVFPESDGGGYAIIGVNLDQERGSNTAVHTAVPTGDGVTISVTNSEGSPLRVQLANDSAGERWCASFSGSGGSFAWDDFSTACWNGSGTTYGGEPLTSIQVLVPGGTDVQVPFDFCFDKLIENGDRAAT
jgi:hypothetical protein